MVPEFLAYSEERNKLSYAQLYVTYISLRCKVKICIFCIPVAADPRTGTEVFLPFGFTLILSERK